ncbi:YaeQ family protein [Pseudomonas sp. NW5]|uniref:YaeQ family protein n=1 Tax=Pseudomonas sp. NW5 TaxID=2934934 RepID=UPI002021F94B|nr:YaeQ family protein [Pseudomonas sp. NW5]MCL7462035.1 YaeQ family protein [Pseudomonas sp. NW5]
MALPSTPYKVELNLTDLDRHIYETLRFTVARHPSETEERLAVRLIAYALWYGEQLAFGRGLSDVDEPALWEKSLDDRVLHWIEVGQPDAERMTWCSRRAERVSVLAYGNLRVWQTKVLDSVRSLKNLNVVAVEPAALETLAHDLPRSISWSVMISDGVLFVTDERGQHEVPLEWLLGERG